MMSSRLDRILAHKREEIKPLQNETEMAQIETAVSLADPVRKLIFPPHGAQPLLIAEIKRHSPSRGALNQIHDVQSLARVYSENGAGAISVLTDETFFKGSLNDFGAARKSTQVPVLRKDFLLERVQILESRAAGADLVLLIVAALGQSQLAQLIVDAEVLGMQALVEVHNEAEVEHAIDAGASLIGVNNRNLHTFEVDLRTCLDLRRHIPNEIVCIAESGIHSNSDAELVRQAGYQAILVGEALVTAQDIASKVRELSGAAMEQR